MLPLLAVPWLPSSSLSKVMGDGDTAVGLMGRPADILGDGDGVGVEGRMYCGRMESYMSSTLVVVTGVKARLGRT